MNRENKFQTPLFIILICCFFEFFSAYGYLMFPLETYKRYGTLKSVENKNLLYPMKINSIGAIGSLYQNQKFQVVFFGTSSLFFNVPWGKTWPEQLKIKLGKQKVHIDNFGVSANNIKRIKMQIDSLCQLKQFYKIAFIQYSFDFIEEGGDDKIAGYYYYRYMSEKKSKISSFQQIQKWHDRQKETRDLYFSSLFLKSPFQQGPSDLTKFSDYNAFKNQEGNLSHSQILSFFNTIKKNYEPKQIQFDLKETIKKLSCIADHILWFPEPLGINKEIFKKYGKKYFFEFPDNYLDQSLTSLNNTIIKINSTHDRFIEKELASYKNVSFIDWRDIFDTKNPNIENYFLDPYHLSVQGHSLVSEYMHPIFYNLLNK